MSHSKNKVHAWKTRKNGPMVIVIPKSIREELKINVGDELLVKIENSKIIYTKNNAYAP